MMRSLYIHIPFCERKCLYCSFAVTVGQRRRVDAYLDCLSQEARRYKGQSISSVYIGGGTPSFLNENQFKDLFRMIGENFRISPHAECTAEVNPESVDEAKAGLLRSLGVNRISLGVQSFNDRYLQYLGRNHNRQKAMDAYGIIRNAGFANVNADLMFSFPRQTSAEIRQDVEAIIRLESEHVSLYMLHLEENSRFYAEGIHLPGDHVQARHYRLVTHQLERAGFIQYEISNFARQGKESRHNLNYWEGGSYIGLGAGAHSYGNGKLSWNVARLPVYMARIQEKGSATEGFQSLDRDGQFKLAALIGLRMNQGVSPKKLEKRFGTSFKEQEQEKMDEFIRQGFLVIEEGYLKATMKGRLVLDELCAQLT